MPNQGHTHHPILGVLLKLGSVVFLGSMAACVKFLGRAVPISETIFVRGAIALLVLTLIAHYTAGLHILKINNWRQHASRSLCGTISMFMLFAALSMIPLADATAISFASPLFITILAMLFLGERIHAFRWTALIIGLVGVVIMISPHLAFHDGNLLGVSVALGAAIFSALAMIFLRNMSRGEPAITITFYFLLTATVCALATLCWGWVMPSPEQWLIMVLTGIFGVVGQLLMTYAYRYADASTIAPLDYTSMIMAVAFGRLLFNETPSRSTWAGAPLVIAAGLIIFWREYRLLQARYRAASDAVA